MKIKAFVVALLMCFGFSVAFGGCNYAEWKYVEAERLELALLHYNLKGNYFVASLMKNNYASNQYAKYRKECLGDMNADVCVSKIEAKQKESFQKMGVEWNAENIKRELDILYEAEQAMARSCKGR